MTPINPKITIRSVYFGMLLLSAAVMIFTVRLTIASELVSLNPSLSKFLNFSLFRPIFGKYENVSC